MLSSTIYSAVQKELPEDYSLGTSEDMFYLPSLGPPSLRPPAARHTFGASGYIEEFSPTSNMSEEESPREPTPQDPWQADKGGICASPELVTTNLDLSCDICDRKYDDLRSLRYGWNPCCSPNKEFD